MHRRPLTAYLLVGLLGFFPISGFPADEENATAAELQTILQELNALDTWFSDAERKEADLQSQLREADTEIAGVNRAVGEIGDALATLGEQLKTLDVRRDKLRADQRRQAQRISEHVAAAYRLTGQDFLKQLLNQENPDEFQRMIRYHRMFSESRLDVLREYRETLAELAATDQEIKVQQTNQQAQRDDLRARKAELDDERQQRLQLITALSRERDDKQTRYEALVADRNRLQTLLAELRRRSIELDGTAFAGARGSMPLPVRGPVRHAFGSRRADGRLRWQGIEISAPHGTTVQAVFAGQVVFAEWLRGFGFMTIIDHGGEYMTLYGNADTLLKRVGDFVESGEAIATAGNSGGRPEPGIYFELRHQGEPKDPISWVVR